MRKIGRTVGILLPILHSFIPASAGHVYGTIVAAQKPVAGVGLVVVCPPKRATHEATTEGDGSYRLFVREKGKCTLTAHYNGQSAAADIYSYDDPVGYNFALLLENGAYKLVRR